MNRDQDETDVVQPDVIKCNMIDFFETFVKRPEELLDCIATLTSHASCKDCKIRRHMPHRIG